MTEILLLTFISLAMGQWITGGSAVYPKNTVIKMGIDHGGGIFNRVWETKGNWRNICFYFATRTCWNVMCYSSVKSCTDHMTNCLLHFFFVMCQKPPSGTLLEEYIVDMFAERDRYKQKYMHFVPSAHAERMRRTEALIDFFLHLILTEFSMCAHWCNRQLLLTTSFCFVLLWSVWTSIGWCKYSLTSASLNFLWRSTGAWYLLINVHWCELPVSGPFSKTERLWF